MLRVDYREHKAIEFFNKNNIEIESVNLPIGDFQINETLLVERKTMSDLSASIIDKRFHEQKTRLKESGCCVLYIIEGSYVAKYGLRLKALKTALLRTQLRDNCHVFLTSTLQETCELVLQLRNEWPYAQKETIVNLQKRNSKITQDSIYANMMCCIPGISLTIFEKIKMKYPNMTALIEGLNSEELQKIDKIGKKTAESIIAAFQ